jgi:hypothetical protein
METRQPAVASELSPKSEAPARRRRRNGDESRARFFLPKSGSTLKSLELGQEFSTEGAALVEALRRDQCFYAVTVWKAVPQQNGGDPVITKQAVTDTRGE